MDGNVRRSLKLCCLDTFEAPGTMARVFGFSAEGGFRLQGRNSFQPHVMHRYGSLHDNSD